ncbi:cell division control protein 48 homolog C-like [Zingiber officinale]|uniref:cell division control protein 48 homolog C-like n=1 Tax=Zingiber officinale TaxID=94328 RepID=UPI001C4AE673|nr:cell division control protein 48 homolog C-like [Zingiber officinale]
MGKRGRRDFGRSPAAILRRRIASVGVNAEEGVDIDSVVANLRSAYPDYARLKFQTFTRNVQRTLESLGRKSSASAAHEDSDEDMDDTGIDPASPGISRRTPGRCDPAESRLLRAESEHLRRRMAVKPDLVDENHSEYSSDDSVFDAKVEPKFDLMKSMLRDGYGKKSNSSKKDDLKSSNKEELALEVEMEKPMKKTKVQNAIDGSDPGSGAEISIEKENSGSGITDTVMEQRPLFCDLGGMRDVIEILKRDVLFPLLHPKLVQKLGISRMTGILLHGPPGCGKSKLAQAIGNETKLPFYKIDATEIVSGVSGASEENIRDLFRKAYRTAPSIILIEEIDAIAAKRDNQQKGMERRIVIQLMACMDQSQKSETFDGKSDYVIVIGTTNNPDVLDSALRRCGRFDREIALGVPDENARLEILSVLTRNLNLEGQFKLSEIARSTPGFVGSDLASLVNQAGNIAMMRMAERKKFQLLLKDKSRDNWWKEPLDDEEIESGRITMSDFKEALKLVQPSSMREGFSPIPNITWDDVGGLTSLKNKFEDFIIKRIKYPAVYEEFGVNLEDGILLYGPPGCGKTLVAKAVANAAGANFIHIQGPQLLNKYVGESELAIRTLFRRARMCSPCIVFFDEVDALACKRGGEGAWVVERQLIQLLVELDGAEERKGVFVIAATNRPDVVDPALLRPGRLGNVIYVPLPNSDERLLILKALARKKPILEDVDLVALAEQCLNFNGADLASLMNGAASAATGEKLDCIDRGINITKPAMIKMSHFEHVLQTIKPSVSMQERIYYEQLSKNFKVS